MKIEIIQGDITELNVDAIVNAANCSLLGGGGVDGAIHRKAGKGLLEECRKFNGCKTGEAVITGAYNLPCKYVIHTPGPVWHGGNNGESDLLHSCYLNCLKVAFKNKLSTIAFPAISTGIYRFPLDQATKIAINTVNNWKENFPQKIIFIAFDNKTYETYKSLLKFKL